MTTKAKHQPPIPNATDLHRTLREFNDSNVRQATLYLSPTCVLRATRMRELGKTRFNPRKVELVVTIGRPNYLEREFVKQCKQSGEPFPVKRVQLKFLRKVR